MRAPLMPVEEAQAAILAAAAALVSVERLPLLQTLGRVLAVDQFSTVNVPPCDNSAMDGYALRFSDLRADDAAIDSGMASMPLPVSQRIPAGHMGQALAAGTVARIFTGAAIPAMADTVVMQEDTEQVGEGIRITDKVTLGQHVRPKGQDIAAGSLVLARGRRLQAQDVGLLASIGVTEVEVFTRLKVAVISTGDELVEPGQPLAEGQIYNSNRYTLAALLLALGCEVIDGGIVADDFASTCQQLQSMAQQADLIISSGGVSVGEEDHVKAAVESLGELALWKLNIKPGKPLAFGNVMGIPFFGLPGNPSSVFVTFALLARPFLLRCQGQQEVAPLITTAVADFDWTRRGSRQEYLRARVVNRQPQAGEERVLVELFANQSSGVLASTSWANALLILPPETTVARGDQVQVILLSELVKG